jgi:hypothetical protein
MDFGIGIATASDSWKLAQRAEELGFTHAWFFDTQVITGDCFVAMAAAALKTSRIRQRAGIETAGRGLARRRLEPARDRHCTRSGTGDRRLGADQARV